MAQADRRGGVDQSEAPPGTEYTIHENVAVDLVDYVRSNTVRNEQQFLLTTFAYATGLMEDTHDYVSSVLIGTPGGGKSHLKDKVDELFTEVHVMDASTGSDRVLIHDDEWDEADIVSMGELQQPPEEMIEFLKRAHGGDEEVVVRTTRGNPSAGFESETIRRKAKSYHFTYAQWSPDMELWDRLLKIPVHESESKNRAVGRMQAGHTNIELDTETDVQYSYPFEAGTAALQRHIGGMKDEAPKYVVLPTGQEYDWDVWEIFEPIFNHGHSAVNRVYGMVFNLIKASALLNYHSRETTTAPIGVGGDTERVEALVAAPQDVANLVRCLRALRATTHEIDRKKRAVVEAIRTKSGADNAVDGLGPIREFLAESDAPEVKREELENILESLQANFLIDIIEDAGETGDIYRAFEWDALGTPRIEQHADIFAGTTDPMSGQPFLDVWEDVQADLRTTAQDLLGGATGDGGDSGLSESRSRSAGRSGGSRVTVDGGSSGANPGGSTGETGLGAFDAGVAAGIDSDPALDPWVQEIGQHMAPVLDGMRINDMSDVPIESFLGLTKLSDPDLSTVETDGSMLDPSHSVWAQPDRSDDWVSTEHEARMAIQDAIELLIDAGVLTFETVHERDATGAPIDATVAIDQTQLDASTE